MKHPRHVRQICALLVACTAAASATDAAPPPRAPAAEALAARHAQFDPAERMLKRPFSSPGYHTTLKGGIVHRTRESLEYAVACLDTGDPKLEQRAAGILERVIDLQDSDPKSPTCGIWPWFLEEPLARMSPPDANWADFCGVQLLEAVLNHEARLPARLVKKIDGALERAARAIERRDVGPGYTNIAIMGSYVTLAVAERLHLADLQNYALERWRIFHRAATQQDGFVEYNSPTYTVVALTEVGRIRRYIRHAEARRLADDIYRIAWQEIALHFHAPSRQWAGPHSRGYSTLLGGNVLALIQEATDGRVDFGAPRTRMESARVPLPCPPEFESHFQRLDAAVTRVQRFNEDQPPVVGTTHLAPSFTLGSVNYGSFWTQQHPVIAYWGTPSEPAFLRVRFLHDGHDFAAAQVFTAQENGDLAGLVNFATDGGDTHPSLDRLKGGTFRARDLRLRFEFGGSAGRIGLKAPASLSEPVVVKLGDLTVRIAIPAAQLGENPARAEVGGERRTACFDVVLFSGAEQTFDLAKIERAFVAFTLRIAANGDAPFPAAVTADDERVALKAGSLSVSAAIRPTTIRRLREAVKFPLP